MKPINKLEYITINMLEDLGFYRTGAGDCSWTHLELATYNLQIVDWGNGSWHFTVRWSGQGIGKMVWLDDLIIGFKFVTGKNILDLR